MSEINSKVVSVIFRKWKWGQFKGQVDAYFPYLPHSSIDHTITSYDSVGGHGKADYHFILNETQLATPEEYAELKDHLEQVVGYKLKVMKRINYDKWLQSFTTILEVG